MNAQTKPRRVVLPVGGHYYEIRFRGVDAALQQIGKWAADPRLPFTWYDAARMARRVRSLEKQ